jgi:hypothetical protein
LPSTNSLESRLAVAVGASVAVLYFRSTASPSLGIITYSCAGRIPVRQADSAIGKAVTMFLALKSLQREALEALPRQSEHGQSGAQVRAID